MRISNRGGRGVLPLILILMMPGTSLYAGGGSDSGDGYDPKIELERASSLITEGRLDDAIGVLVEIARNDPEQMERVQKLILGIRESENEITVIFDQIQEVIASDDLNPDEQLRQIENFIEQIKVLDSDPESDTWKNLSFVESGLRLSLDENRRDDFFVRGNEKLSLGLYRDAVDEYENGFIDDVYGDQQTYLKYRDAESPSDIDNYSTVPERQTTIFDAYRINAPEGDRIINEIGQALEFWRDNSLELAALSSEAIDIIETANPAAWSDDLTAYYENMALVDLDIQSVRGLDDDLNTVKSQLYEDLNGASEDFRYDRIRSFLNGREGRNPEGIIYAQEIQWENSYINVLSGMFERVRVPYEAGRAQFKTGLWDESANSFSLATTNSENSLAFLQVADSHANAHRESGISRFTEVFDPLSLELRYTSIASGILTELNNISRTQPRTDDAALAALSLLEIQALAEELQKSIDLIEDLLVNWDESTGPYELSPGDDSPEVQEIDRNVKNDLNSVLANLYNLRVNVFILYMEPRYNILDVDVSALLESSPISISEAEDLINDGRPGAALNQYIEPALTANENLSTAVVDFLETVDDVLINSSSAEDSQKFQDFGTRAETLLVLLSDDKDRLTATRTGALSLRNSALRAETIAITALDEAQGLIQSAREADTRGRNTNNINESYRAKDLYVSAGAALDRAGDQLLQVELNDKDVASNSGIRERLAELEAETLSAPRNLAVTVRDYAIEEADKAFNERRYGEGLSVLLLAQEFWVNIFGEEDTRLRERIVRFRVVQQSAQNTIISSSDPLYMEMNQYLNLANRYYNEGLRLLPSGTSNDRNPDATRAFRAAEDLVKQVTNVFPGNAAALLLQMKILQATDPNDYAVTVRDLISEAGTALRLNNREAIVGTDFEQGLDPQLQAVKSFDPDFSGLSAVTDRIDIYLGRVIPQPSQADINESRRITTTASSDWDQTKTLGNNAVSAASPGLIRRLDGALVLWENNIEAANLQDEIRFYSEPPALPDNLRRLLDVAEEQRFQNNRSAVETIYQSIADTYPAFLSHPEVLKLRTWLGIN